MQHENELQQMAVADLAQRCTQETVLYSKNQDYDSRYCFELFRRAIVRRDNEAWDAVYTQYRPQVERWVDRLCRIHGFAQVDQEAQDFTIQAFERFSKYYIEDKLTESKSLAGVLSYLQLCVNGAILDCLRRMHYEQIEFDGPLKNEKDLNPEASPEERMQGEDLWRLIQTRLKDDKEYTVVYAWFILGLSPRQVLAKHLGVFRDIAELYQCRANVLARLERDPEIGKIAHWSDA